MADKKRIVILGSGWAAINFIRNLNVKEYHVQCISPKPYLLFQPLLPSVVGQSLDVSTVVTPIMDLLPSEVSYTIDEMRMVDPKKKLVILASGDIRPYDILVYAIGTTVNTFGIPGVKEHCYFLKELEDCERLRARIAEDMTWASGGLKEGISAGELKSRLSYCFVGAGPTGVETLAEIADLVQRHHSELIPYVRFHLIEMGPKLLPTMKPITSEAVLKHFMESYPSDMVKVHLNTTLCRVEDDHVVVKCQNPPGGAGFKIIEEDKDMTLVSIPAGMVLWSSGITQRPETRILMDIQKEAGCKPAPGVRVYPDMSAIGMDDVYILGDCAFIEPRPLSELATTEQISTIDDALEFLKKPRVKNMYPQTDLLQTPLDKDITDVVGLFKSLDEKFRSPPPTAQVATQHGKYLAEIFNSGREAPAHTFRFNNQGSLCYTGNGRAALEMGKLTLTPQYRFTGILWRAVYCKLQPTFSKKIHIAIEYLCGH